MGFMFVEQSQSEIKVEIFNQEYKFELLKLFEFDSDRKRMSIIVK